MVILFESIIACLLFTIFVIPSCIKNPLSWIDDYPPAIAKKVQQLGLIEKGNIQKSKNVIIKKIIFSIIVILLATFVIFKFNEADTFWKGFLFSYIIWFIVDWYDAIVIDCLWFCHSKKVVIVGTEGMKEYKDYLFHIKGSLKGMILGIPICLIIGICIEILMLVIR